MSLRSDDSLPGFGMSRAFRAPTMRDAFVRVKAAIGPEAVILSTRDLGNAVDPSERFEVVAATPSGVAAKPAADDAGKPVPQQNPDELVRQLRLLEQAVKSLESQLQTLGEKERRPRPTPNPEQVDPSIAQLVDAGVDKAVASELVARAVRRNTPRHGLMVARTPDLPDELARTIRAAVPIWDLPHGSVAAFVGPAGTGKTSTLLKVAGLARFAHQRSVAIVSTDLERLGTWEQLAMYADVMGIPARPARDRAELDHALEVFHDADLVLVDTPGANPFDDAARVRVMKVISGREVRHHLVVPATASAGLLAEILRVYETPALESLIVTRIDEARNLGAVVACGVLTDVPVSHLSTGREIPDDLEVFDPERVTRSVLARAS